MLLDDETPGELGPQPFDERGFARLAGLFGPLNWRVGLVVGLALLTGGGATLATADLGGRDEPEQASNRIEAETPAATASRVEPEGAASPGLGQSDADLAPLSAPTGDATTTASSTTSSVDATTTSAASEAGDDPSSSATTADDSTTGSTAGTTTTTADPTNTTRGDTSATTRATTSTTRASTTTTRPTTTTTRATTTTTTTQAGNSCATGAEFELVMRDDFSGSSIGGQWSRWDSPGNAGNGRRVSSALSVADGRLTIRAQMVDGTLQSGGMNHTLAQTYGKYRFRVRTDVDPSRTMSGVILTWPASDAHPRDGENNVYETLPHQDSATRDPFYTFIHKPFGSHSDQEYKIWRADAAQWQTMTMEWTPDRITVWRDGGESWTVNETGADLIPDVDHRFHIQLDATKQSISGPVTMQVDFAEVYRYCG